MRTMIIPVLAGLLLAGSTAFAAEPVVNVSPKAHPNLAAAQRLSRKAFEKIVEAQKANNSDMEGHARKAKDLLEQVNLELKLAAEAANMNKGR
jgi:ABC-type branched-subunit amino acid transport system ATPase component